mmetsp:Transcript_3856/g.4317  ORF Transcript_3856/g.4317 Transcript_3856/m.4317 type:complete len:141 (+) Transcript_3856:215-637(+)
MAATQSVVRRPTQALVLQNRSLSLPSRKPCGVGQAFPLFPVAVAAAITFTLTGIPAAFVGRIISVLSARFITSSTAAMITGTSSNATMSTLIAGAGVSRFLVQMNLKRFRCWFCNWLDCKDCKDCAAERFQVSKSSASVL